MIIKPKDIIKLYKYQSLIELHDDHEEKEWHRRLQKILEQNIWLNPLSEFNDPFERNFKYTENPRKALKDEKLFKFFYEFYCADTNTEISKKEFKAILVSQAFKKRIGEVSNEWIDIPFSRHAAYSFTRDPSNIPMWAHYANNHRGYCLIFDLNISFFSKILNIPDIPQYIQDILGGKEILNFYLPTLGATVAFAKVRYCKSPKIMKLNKLLILQNYELAEYLLINFLAVKYYQWKYEEEYRLVVNINSKENGLLNLQSLMPFLRVTGIIMGCKLDDNEKQFILNQSQINNISVYQAECSKEAYAVNHYLVKDNSQDYYLKYTEKK